MGGWSEAVALSGSDAEEELVQTRQVVCKKNDKDMRCTLLLFFMNREVNFGGDEKRG